MQMTEEKQIRCNRCNKLFDAKDQQIITVKQILEASGGQIVDVRNV